jgi:hypothetical protein
MYPVIKIYEGGMAIDIEQVDTNYGIYSIANLGYSSVQCKSTPFTMRQMVLTCPFGDITSILDEGTAFGVTPASSTKKDACRRSENYSNLECSKKLNQ